MKYYPQITSWYIIYIYLYTKVGGLVRKNNKYLPSNLFKSCLESNWT